MTPYPKVETLFFKAFYLGSSPDRVTIVPLVLNTVTYSHRPQYHLVFDDNFTTTDFLHITKIPSHWSAINFLYSDQASFHILHESWNDPPENFSSAHFVVVQQHHHLFY
jgi:hypothetical protein